MKLTSANDELYRRQDDERYEDLQSLWQYCHERKERCEDLWHAPRNIATTANGSLKLQVGADSFAMNDWSFGQLCRLARVSKETVNRLSPATASQVVAETLPRTGDKPLQLLSEGDSVRSIHGTAYTRLWDADLVRTVREFATDFQPPQKGCNGATGLYAGEQDTFCFLIDPAGWCEIDGDAFAPGLFVWNSEVGRRSLGIETFWFAAVCQNHIVWDATNVVSWKRKHTASVADGLTEIRRIIAELVAKRDERRDGFVKVVTKAMQTKLGDSEEATRLLRKHGITQRLAKRALELAQRNGALTIWSIVDALTDLSHDLNAGDRTEADSKASQLLALV